MILRKRLAKEKGAIVRIHVIQHVAFEGPAAIAQWAELRGHELTSALALTEEFPATDDVGLLVVMGGPMAADDDAGNPWFAAEKHFIADAIAGGGSVLGVCLGAQLVAEVIGGRVRRNEHREIGWYPVEPTADAAYSPLFADWRGPVVVGQWHGDTFDLPEGMEPLLSSEACRNQAFVFDGRVVGVQFHLEWTMEALEALVATCSDDLGDRGLYVTSAEQFMDEALERIAECRPRLFALLDALVDGVRGSESGGEST